MIKKILFCLSLPILLSLTPKSNVGFPTVSAEIELDNARRLKAESERELLRAKNEWLTSYYLLKEKDKTK